MRDTALLGELVTVPVDACPGVLPSYAIAAADALDDLVELGRQISIFANFGVVPPPLEADALCFAAGQAEPEPRVVRPLAQSRKVRGGSAGNIQTETPPGAVQRRRPHASVGGEVITMNTRSCSPEL